MRPAGRVFETPVLVYFGRGSEITLYFDFWETVRKIWETVSVLQISLKNIAKACESDMRKRNTTESLLYKGVVTFSTGGETTDWNFPLSVNLQKICSAWWHLALLVKSVYGWTYRE